MKLFLIATVFNMLLFVCSGTVVAANANPPPFEETVMSDTNVDQSISIMYETDVSTIQSGYIKEHKNSGNTTAFKKKKRYNRINSSVEKSQYDLIDKKQFHRRILLD